MNTPKSSKKTIIIMVVIIVVAIIAYFYYEGGNTVTSSSLETSQVTSDAQAAGARVLNLLNQIKSLKIDTSLFSDPAYETLRDYTVAIPQEQVGRANPFAPIPGLQATTTR